MSIKIGVRKYVGNGVSVGAYFPIQYLLWTILAIPFVLATVYVGFDLLYQNAVAGDIRSTMILISFILAPIIVIIAYNYKTICNVCRAFMSGWNSK